MPTARIAKHHLVRCVKNVQTKNNMSKRIQIYLPNQEMFSIWLGGVFSGKTVKDIDAYLEGSGVRITFVDGSYELLSGFPFIYTHSSKTREKCKHLWLEIDYQHDLKDQFNEQCQKCKLLRLWKKSNSYE